MILVSVWFVCVFVFLHSFFLGFSFVSFAVGCCNYNNQCMWVVGGSGDQEKEVVAEGEWQILVSVSAFH